MEDVLAKISASHKRGNHGLEYLHPICTTQFWLG